MTIPTAVALEQERNAQREALLVEEKELTRTRDVPAGERRRLPMVGVSEAIRTYRTRARAAEELSSIWAHEYAPQELAGGRS
jgi:predicted dithiol-disulfide oxidoreductase (DUF899 family)